MAQMMQPTAIRKPHLFLSHSSIDKPFVYRLAEDLNICQIDIWFDDFELKVGDSLIDKLSTAIEDARFIGLILSNAFLKSKWASNELKQALSREIREARSIILPIVIEKVPIPPFIEDKIYLDFSKDYYSALSNLAGMLHNLNVRALKEGVNKIKPGKLSDCINVLRYAGLEPYTIVDKEVFNELVNAGGHQHAYTQSNRLLGESYYLSDILEVQFDAAEILKNKKVSERTKDYVRKIFNALH